MNSENNTYEKKSLKSFIKANPDWNELAKDCVGFANARGGTIVIGIEDGEELPPDNQKIPDEIVENVRIRISELTINVGLNVSKEKASNGGEHIKIDILPSQATIASTTKDQYYIRISDQCKPVLPDELSRLYTDKPAFIWETKVVQKIQIKDCDQEK
ncbi:MAG TPA: ATP-binding protein, partial [Bacteroidales bacterium]|nr:ATP-binding protein [Bacteroidales bacterium]